LLVHSGFDCLSRISSWMVVSEHRLQGCRVQGLKSLRENPPVENLIVPRIRGAPYLARLSRGVGNHGPRLAVPWGPKNVNRQPWSPTSREKRARYGAPPDSWSGQKSVGSHANSKAQPCCAVSARLKSCPHTKLWPPRSTSSRHVMPNSFVAGWVIWPLSG
jgi:hypothetical protein